MATSTEVLAAQIEALRREVAAMKSGSQLAFSSIDNGQMVVTQNDGAGNQQVTTIVGTQYDGTSGAVVVAGPKPPVPGPPTLLTAIGGVKVQCHGAFADPQPGFSSPVVAPLDFSGFDVHVSTDPSFPEIGFGTSHGTIVSAAGGEIFVSWPASGTPLYARLVTRSKAGKFSDPGATAGPTLSGQVQLGDLGFDITQYGGGTTIYYTVAPATPTAPTWGFSVGDIWLQETGATSGVAGGQPAGTPIYQTWRWLGSRWALLQDQGISNSLAAAILAQSMAAAKAQVFTQPEKPLWSGAAGTAYWIDNDNGNVSNVWDGGQWVPFQIGNGAIQPNSLIASNVIATGSVTAALLEANMVLATTIIAGVVKGDHATMQGDGFHVYRTITGEGVVEIGRLASGNSNFLGIADSTGTQVATIGDDGSASFTSLNVNTSPVFGGYDLVTMLNSCSNAGSGNPLADQGARTTIGWASAPINGISTEMGLTEMACTVTAGRWYLIGYEVSYSRQDTTAADCEARVRIRDGGTGTPTITSPLIMYRQHSEANQKGWDISVQRFGFWQPSTSGVHRLLLSISAGDGLAGMFLNVADVNAVPSIFVIDAGQNHPVQAQTNRGGGGTVAPPQNFDTGNIVPSGWWRYNGSNGLRTDTSDVVQGWDPSGYNGDGHGGWNFNIPNISGTVDRVDLYIYNNFSYFNSGGRAFISLVANANTGTPGAIQGAYDPGVTYPKPGPVTVTLPGGWYPSFRGRTSIGLYLGPIGSSNETYYIRADGPSARLRIWYHQ